MVINLMKSEEVDDYFFFGNEQTRATQKLIVSDVLSAIFGMGNHRIEHDD